MHMANSKESYIPPLVSIYEVVIEQGFAQTSEPSGQFNPPSWEEEPF